MRSTRILALDTSSRYLCLGIADGERAYEYSLDTGLALSRVLVPTIGRALAAAGLTPADIGHYAVGLGPGSFTALRIGHAAIKAMAWVNGKKIAGIPTLEILARHPLIPDGIVVPAVDAKRSMLYCSWFCKTGSRVERLTPDRLLRYDDFMSFMAKIMRAHRKKRIIIGGDGLLACAAAVKKAFPSAQLLEKDFWYPQPQVLIELSRRSIAGRKGIDAFTLEPVYLYEQECQIRVPRGR